MSELPPVFVISLARAKERRAHIAERLVGVPHEIVDAVDGAALDLDALAAEGRLRQDKARKLCRAAALVPGEIDCYLSYYHLWERIAEQTQECALVLEDDMEFADDFFQVVADVANSPWHWEVVNLATIKAMPMAKVLHPVGNGRKFGLSSRAGVCTSAYLLRPSGAQKLLSYCHEIREPVDAVYVRWWRHGAVFYYVSPPAARQARHFGSDAGGSARAAIIPFSSHITSSIHRKREGIACKWAVLNHQPRKK